jgi:hypothetical protein
MLITNYSTDPHVYREPQASGARYRWYPSETKDVPDSVGRLMLQTHPEKFLPPADRETYATTEIGADSNTEMEATPRNRRRQGTGTHAG